MSALIVTPAFLMMSYGFYMLAMNSYARGESLVASVALALALYTLYLSILCCMPGVMVVGSTGAIIVYTVFQYGCGFVGGYLGLCAQEELKGKPSFLKRKIDSGIEAVTRGGRTAYSSLQGRFSKNT